MTDTQKQNWDLIVSVLHWNGENKDKFTDEERYNLYLMCDGFGKRSREELLRINDGWDWSHVRDSSHDTITQVADHIRELLITRCCTQCGELYNNCWCDGSRPDLEG